MVSYQPQVTQAEPPPPGKKVIYVPLPGAVTRPGIPAALRRPPMFQPLSGSMVRPQLQYGMVGANAWNCGPGANFPRMPQADGWQADGWQSEGWQSYGWQSDGWQSGGWQSGAWQSKGGTVRLSDIKGADTKSANAKSANLTQDSTSRQQSSSNNLGDFASMKEVSPALAALMQG